MIQIFRVEIEGVDNTESVESTTITKVVNRFYDVITVTMSDQTNISTLLGKSIQIFYGDTSVSGFIFSAEKIGRNKFSINARTVGGKLSEPFSPFENTIDDATTALELCALYGGIIGRTISWDSEDLDFGGSYERNGTMLTALTALATTIGAEYYDNGTVIKIEPNKVIGDGYTHELKDDEYFDFVSNLESLYNAGVGVVRTSTGAISGDDILDANKINMDVFSDGSAHIYTIPSGQIEVAKGIDVLDTIKTKVITDNVTMVEESVFYLKAPIKSIESVKINGFEITGYNYQDGASVVYFETPQTGYLEIVYIGYYQEGTPHYTQTPNGNLAVVEMYYLNQVLKMYWYINSSDLLSSDGVRIYVERDPFIYRGYKTYMLDGGIPYAKVYANGISFFETRDYEVGEYINKLTPSLSPVNVIDGDYEYRVDEDATVLLITSFGIEISAVETIDGDEKVLTFDKYYPKVELTLSEPAHVITVPPTEIEGEIIMTVENITSNVVSEFDIGNVDANDIDTIPCKLNQYVPIDMVEQANVDLQIVSGYTFTVTNPQGSSEDIVCGVDGILKIWIDMNGEWKIYVTPVTGRTDNYVVLTVTV